MAGCTYTNRMLLMLPGQTGCKDSLSLYRTVSICSSADAYTAGHVT